MSTEVVVNGRAVSVTMDPSTPLLTVLRDELGLLGTRFGCGLGLCGACFVRLGDTVVASCDTPLWQAAGTHVTTVEGLISADGQPHPVQQAILDRQAAQCGFCISGVVVRAAALLDKHPSPDRTAVCAALERNLCRCGVQHRIVDAVVAAGAGGTTCERDTHPATERAGIGSGVVTGPAPRVVPEPPTGRGLATSLTQTGHDLPPDIEANPRLGTWVTVTDDGLLGVRVGKVELGQGILTALTQIVADALGVPLPLVRLLPAITGVGPNQGLTAGSLSTSQAAPALRHVGTFVRHQVARLAATDWREPIDAITVGGGQVRDSHGHATSYVRLVRAIDPATDLRSFDLTTLGAVSVVSVGTDVPRLDLPDKVLGHPRYIADLRPEGLLFGRVLRPPSIGARLLDVDGSRLDPSVTVVRDGSFVGVVTEGEAAADRALDALRAACTWEEVDVLPDEDDVVAFLRAGPHEDIPVLTEEAATPAAGATVVRATYSRPFLAHASVAPSCGVAKWSREAVHVWSHSQGIHELRDAIATALGLTAASVTVEHVENAGCYGHNAADDAAFDAVLLARAAPGRPVQVRWSRSDELGWAPLASAMTVDLEARLVEGRVTNWRHDVWSQGHSTRPGYAGTPGLLAAGHLAEPLPTPAPIDPPLKAGGGTTRNAVPIYDVGPRRVIGHRLTQTPLRSSAMRSLGAYTNVFAIESFMDELAAVGGVDPVEFRLAHLSDPRARVVIEEVARRAGWADPLPQDQGRGIGFARYKNTGAYCAVVAEVEVIHEVRVLRLTAAVDVGLVINPDGVRNQVGGGATQSASWTLKERVRFNRRCITSTDWESYPILRFDEAPLVEVHLVDRPDLPPLGAGECAQGPTAAAIANAVYDVLGVRVRDLPLTSEAVIAVIEGGERTTRGGP